MRTTNECIDFLKSKIKDSKYKDTMFFTSIIKHLQDYEKLKSKEEAEDTFHNILCDVLGINEDDGLSNDALIDILNNNEISEETKKEIETILQKKEERQLKKYDEYTKSQVEEVTDDDVEALKNGIGERISEEHLNIIRKYWKAN